MKRKRHGGPDPAVGGSSRTAENMKEEKRKKDAEKPLSERAAEVRQVASSWPQIGSS